MFRTFLSALLVVCLAGDSFSETPISNSSPAAPVNSVVVTGGPDTTVGDVTVATSMLAFPDDIVETHSERPARLTFKGNVFTLLGNSKIKLNSESVAELQSGGIIVASSSRYTITSACFVAQPVGTIDTRYAIVPHEGKIFIRSEVGDLKVTSKASKQEVIVSHAETAVFAGCGTPSAKLSVSGDSDRIYQGVFGSALGAGVAVVCTLPTGSKQPMSGESRHVCY